MFDSGRSYFLVRSHIRLAPIISSDVYIYIYIYKLLYLDLNSNLLIYPISIMNAAFQ